MDSNSSFEHLIDDTICQNQCTLERFMEDVLFLETARGDMVANQCRHNGWAVPWGYPVLAFVRPEPDVNDKCTTCGLRGGTGGALTPRQL